MRVLAFRKRLDTSIYCEGEQEFLWYLMPKAEKYNPKSFSVSQKLEQMLCLGKCIKQLHELGYAHRDIKPKNLLVLEGKVCLADFGLVWNISDTDEHITEVNDRLGPQAIRPPELQPIEKIDGMIIENQMYIYMQKLFGWYYCVTIVVFLRNILELLMLYIYQKRNFSLKLRSHYIVFWKLPLSIIIGNELV